MIHSFNISTLPMFSAKCRRNIQRKLSAIRLTKNHSPATKKLPQDTDRATSYYSHTQVSA
jgi:hypothetical protein